MRAETIRHHAHLERYDARLTHVRLRHGAASQLFLARAKTSHLTARTLLPSPSLAARHPKHIPSTPSNSIAARSLRKLDASALDDVQSTPSRTGACTESAHRSCHRDPSRVRSSRNDIPPAQGRIGDVLGAFVPIPRVPTHVGGHFFFIFPSPSTPPSLSVFAHLLVV